jgi:hypothetical protein
MQTIIYRKSDLLTVGTVQKNYPKTIENHYEWEIEHNVIPNFGGTIEDYDFIVTDISRVKLVKNNNLVEAVERDETKEEKKEKILLELKQLDVEIPRIIEDIIEQGNFTIHHNKQNIINTKKALRLQLQALEV